jgi:hypothetical protein
VTTTEGQGPLVRAAALRDAGLNLLLLTLAECRGLVATLADLAVLKSFAEVLPAKRLGPTTQEAHRVLFGGRLPGAVPDPPLPDSSLPLELGEAGYQTLGAADGLFNDQALVANFERIALTEETEAAERLDSLRRAIDPGALFLAFAQLTDTRYQRGWGFADQVAAAERVDAALPRLLSELPANTVVVVCSDYGVCFGEGNCWGKRRDHPAHRDVFVACFRLDGGAWP